MSDTGPDMGLSDKTKAAMPSVPDGWTAYPSLGGGFGAKKFFPSLGAYKDIVTSDQDELSNLCETADKDFGDNPVTAPADDPFEDAVKAPEPFAPFTASAPASEEITPPDTSTPATDAPTT